MKVSVNWLRELARVEADEANLSARLTAAGLEVEGRTRVGAFAGVVVAEVRAKERHPKADKLTLVDVWDGEAVTRVVCGAPNVPEPGGKVAWARPGARLPDDQGGERVLEAREVRGVLSPGMLCAEDELGLGAGHDGILILDGDAEPGASVAALLGLPDTILELNVTPNRPDCLGHVGVAREVAALVSLRPIAAKVGARFALAPVPLDEQGPPIAELASVDLVDASGCPRYLARVVTDVRVAPSPLPLRLRLQALGVRAINNVVDATNLVLLETGHPLHAFDLDKLAARRVVVRRARAGEAIVTLDGQERTLDADDVAICDAERPVAVAGIMGGRDSEVDAGTTRLLIESAYFEPARIRRTGRRLGLKTEASHRFERGADPNDGVERASRRCTSLVHALAGGRIARGAIDAYPSRIEPRTVSLRPSRTDRVLGLVTPPDDQERILVALAIESDTEDGSTLECRVPTFRPDLTREIDLIEEIARVRGFDAVPTTFPPLARPALRAHDERSDAARDALAAMGFSESIGYAFVGPDRLAALGFDESDPRSRPMRLSNPLREEQSALRTSLAPGLLAALSRNHARGNTDVRLFEIGRIFLPRAAATARGPHDRDVGLPDERTTVAGVIAGRRAGWLKPGEELDFFDVKGVVESLLLALGGPRGAGGAAGIEGVRPPAPGEAPWLHPGLSATAISDDGTPVAFFGEVHPAVRDRLDVPVRAFAFEVDLSRLRPPNAPRAVDLPRYPGSSRDLSFFVDRGVPAADLARVMREAGSLLASVRPLEDYRDEGRVPPGKKGMLWALAYRAPDRTLTDAEVNLEHARVVAALASRYAVDMR